MGDEVVEASSEGAAVLEAEAAARGADEAAAAAATPGAAFAIELGSEGAVWGGWCCDRADELCDGSNIASCGAVIGALLGVFPCFSRISPPSLTVWA